MANEITPAIVTEAWQLRRLGIYTMREIADKLGVNREALILAMTDNKTTDERNVLPGK